MKCACDLHLLDLPGQKPRGACLEFRPNQPGDLHCAWCEHEGKCHENILNELARLGWSETRALNILQDRGIISDNCVTLTDISEGDAIKAANYLKTI